MPKGEYSTHYTQEQLATHQEEGQYSCAWDSILSLPVASQVICDLQQDVSTSLCHVPFAVFPLSLPLAVFKTAWLLALALPLLLQTTLSHPLNCHHQLPSYTLSHQLCFIWSTNKSCACKEWPQRRPSLLPGVISCP